MIAILDYGVGNLKSLQNAFNKLDHPCQLLRSAENISRFDRLILPGVGAFGFAMQNIRRLRFDQAIREFIASGRPVLGICLGMQLLLDRSEEGDEHGLGVIRGQVRKLNGNLKVPHIGWNEIEIHRDSALFRDLPDSRHAYFVHSYFCEPDEIDYVVATSDYGQAVPSVIQKERVFGVQFHPEKSQELGLQILRNFSECG